MADAEGPTLRRAGFLFVGTQAHRQQPSLLKQAARLRKLFLHQASPVPTGRLARNSSEESGSGNFSTLLQNPGLAKGGLSGQMWHRPVYSSSQELGGTEV